MSLERNSCLSPGVKHLICEVGLTSQLHPNSINGNGLLNWETIESVLVREENDTPSYFVESTMELAPIFHSVQAYFDTLDRIGFKNFMELCEKCTRWTSSPHLAISLARTLCEYTEDNEVDILEWLLLYFPLFERSLGDVYLCKGQQCPSLLKDLLMTDELKTLLNSTVIKLLRILIGPPTSLNLRNIVWHGFPKPGEIPLQYAHLMLSLLPSLGELLLDNGVYPERIIHRNFIKIPECKEMKYPGHDIDDHIDDFSILVEESKLLFPTMKPMWTRAIHRYSTREYGKCASVILPLLEQSVRTLFTEVNNCPDRILTAESSAFFTTFDEMLVKRLPNGEQNQLERLFTVGLFDCLLDLLNYPEGPRIRDKLSHGEVDIDNFPKNLAKEIIVACGALLTLNSNSRLPVFLMNEYKSKFHPVSLLRQAIIESSHSLTKWPSMPRPAMDEIGHVCDWDEEQTLKDITLFLTKSLTNIDAHYCTNTTQMNVSIFGEEFTESFVQWIAQTHIATTFRYQY